MTEKTLPSRVRQVKNGTARAVEAIANLRDWKEATAQKAVEAQGVANHDVLLDEI